PAVWGRARRACTEARRVGLADAAAWPSAVRPRNRTQRWTVGVSTGADQGRGAGGRTRSRVGADPSPGGVAVRRRSGARGERASQAEWRAGAFVVGSRAGPVPREGRVPARYAPLRGALDRGTGPVVAR